MPIYEYRCKGCGLVFDAFQSLGEDGKNLECPDCSTKGPEKLISSFASCGSGATSGQAPSAPSCGSGGFG